MTGHRRPKEACTICSIPGQMCILAEWAVTHGHVKAPQCSEGKRISSGKTLDRPRNER